MSPKPGRKGPALYRFGTESTDGVTDGVGQVAEGVGDHISKRWPFILLLGVFVKIRSDQMARRRG